MLRTKEQPWTKEQIKRLAANRKKLLELFPSIEFFNAKDSANAYMQLNAKTTSGFAYTLKVPIPKHYPNSMVHLYVSDPNPLKTRDNGTVNCLGESHAFHTHRNQLYNGCVEICYTDTWNPDISLAKVITSGVIWMQCYQIHLEESGDCIHDILQKYKNSFKDLFDQC